VERELARGAMGIVYQAHDPAIGRPVAIKLVRADLLAGEDHELYLARFRQEAQAAGRCMHPNIVSIYDYALHEGNPFLAMEYVDGIGLGEAMHRTGRFTPEAAVAVILQVLIET
jgi:eukaryotic-like serine/threonine-protein kinase